MVWRAWSSKIVNFDKIIDAQNINRIVGVENGNHLEQRNMQKNVMVNSTGYIQKQYAFPNTCMKGKSAKGSK